MSTQAAPVHGKSQVHGSISNGVAAAAAIADAPADEPVSSGDSVVLSYLESTPLRVAGLVTGRSYEFSAEQPAREVDARDAAALLQTRFFRRG